MMFRTQGPWLGQVRLVARPGMGSKGDVPKENEWKYSLPTPPMEAKSPGVGCLFLGIKGPAAPSAAPSSGTEPVIVDPALDWGEILQQHILVYDAANYSPEALSLRIEEAVKFGAYIIRETPVPASLEPGYNARQPQELRDVPVAGTSKFVWACPKEQPQTVGPQPGPSPQTLQLPDAPKPDLVPVAAGAGVVAILAAVIAGAFGK